MYTRNFFSEIRTNVCQNYGLFGVRLTDEVTVHALAVVYNLSIEYFAAFWCNKR